MPERVLEPRRGEYRKKLKGDGALSEQCPFCNPKKISKQICRSFRFVHWTIIVNTNPYMDGNLMIVSRRHVEQLENLTAEEKSEWHLAVCETKKVLGELFKTTSFNVSINLGELSGGSIRHIHWQIIPRPRMIQHNSINIFADLFVITVAPEKLVKMIDARRKNKH